MSSLIQEQHTYLPGRMLSTLCFRGMEGGGAGAVATGFRDSDCHFRRVRELLRALLVLILRCVKSHPFFELTMNDNRWPQGLIRLVGFEIRAYQ